MIAVVLPFPTVGATITAMADVIEEVARVGLAGWVRQSEQGWDEPRVLGVLGDELYLVEIDASNRERVLLDLVETHGVDDHGVRIELALFGEGGGFFSSSMNFLELWPKVAADMPAEVFVDSYYKAAFTEHAGEIVMSVRHAMRPADGPPKRRFRFPRNKYEQAMSELERASRSIRDDLIAAAQQRAPEKVDSIRELLSAGAPNLGLQPTRPAIGGWGRRLPRGRGGLRS